MKKYNFNDVMREWKRMCEYMEEKYKDDCCSYCKLGTCGAIWEMERSDWDLIGATIMRWAEDHPVPQYPLMINVLEEYFGMDLKKMPPLNEETWIWNWLNTHQIDVENAKKLGIKPQEEKDV